MKEKGKYEDHVIKKHNKTIKDSTKKKINKEKKKINSYDNDYSDHTRNYRHGNKNKDDKYWSYNNKSVYYYPSKKTENIENASDSSDHCLKNKKKHIQRSNSLDENDYKNSKGNNKSKMKKLGFSYNSFNYFNDSIEKNKLSHKYIVEEKLKYEKDVFEKAYGLSLQSDEYFDNFLFETKSGEKHINKNTGKTSMQYECYSCKAKNYYSNVQCYKCKKLRKK
ncbi:conserved Plasmodium protein, unknown function [Plasmodium berghei]|uniref:RanBP2-type domain-containing protein n=3 Tax=Plasmodium berghei TaxID=5821 RepID=A0A509AJB5_PLABA|nr:conserved Plasmodium protein, unknown function [Plasmodium berghei ANKA]CXI20034.1 conserved Plasmodium protein, unknown function [Plasmodium berghei]SCM19903.1 conserved Plasmodium protein, unknown function [Plasmodium berghei]SCO59993.1 conserved Plasmodium protein, unknown function [Plasmodium berghei]VUC54870.1 conserved Plasmodium protein, unknown function [Plasmodium berghei ANKA]|eukprot:XP_034420695.1 conserved Plasmodium protein, unknown function [Plasmodium berghei ANKA]